MDGDTTTIDLTILEERLGQLSAALHVDAGKILEDEARMFLRAAIKLTPPSKRLIGENALARDLHRIIAVVEDPVAEHIAADFGTDNIRHWMTSSVTGQREEWLWNKLDVHGHGLPAWHKSHLKPPGKEHRSGQTVRIRYGQKNMGAWVEQYVTSASAFLNYFKTKAKDVGTLRAAWGICFVELGGRLPEWIRRNIGRRKGILTGNTNDRTHPWIRMTNRADGVESTRELVNTALKIRLNAMTRRLMLVTNGYAQDIKQKLKVSPKAFITPESMSFSD